MKMHSTCIDEQYERNTVHQERHANLLGSVFYDERVTTADCNLKLNNNGEADEQHFRFMSNLQNNIIFKESRDKGPRGIF